MIPKMDIAINDFSAGELNSDVKRNANNVTGGRVMSNWRTLNSRKMKNRPGRRVLFLESGRVDEVLMSPGNTFKLLFGNGTLRVRDATGAQVFTQAGFAWTFSTAKNVVLAVYQNSIYITFAGQVPKVLTWDGVSTWSVIDFAETVTNNQKRTFFYRISPKAITLSLSAYTGAGVTATASSAVFVVGMIGTRLRYANRQVLITGYTSPTVVTVTVEETIYFAMELSFASDPAEVFQIGDLVQGLDSVTEAVVVSFPGANKMWVQKIAGGLLTVTTSTVVGPHGSLNDTAEANLAAPLAVTIWDEEVMNSYRGWPASCFVDQNRLGFCNFPSVPSGIGWSGLASPNDLYVDALVTSAMFELAPNKSQVLYVQAAAESSEIVFCDNRVYYIPISPSNPLRPGSVQFTQISGEGCYPVQPKLVQEVTLFIAAGGKRVSAIMAVGQTNRPYNIADLTELHNHLLSTPVALAAPTSDDTFNERYAYVLNSDGTLAVGKYTVETGKGAAAIGWLPWSGAGTIAWINALSANVIFSTSYAPNGIGSVSVIEQLDDTIYLDGAMFYNVVPAALTPGGGLGPFWWLPLGSVTLMDQSTRAMGTYLIDANGFIIPQNNGGEDLTVATLIGGQPWTATYEPFIPHAAPGQDVQQRMRRRRVAEMAVSFQQSSGFVCANRRVPAFFEDDNATVAPTLREDTEKFRVRGRSFDPRVQLVKDTPGPLIITEVGIEVTV